VLVSEAEKRHSIPLVNEILRDRTDLQCWTQDSRESL